jgi:hypothetical protein
MAYRSAQKLRRDNALSEITSDTTLKAAALANLGLTDVAGSRVNVATGKNLNVSNTLTLAGTDSTTMTFPSTSATIARTDAANTFTGVQTMTSPVLTTPSLGVATATSINGNAITTGTGTLTLGAGKTTTFDHTSTFTTTDAQTYTFPTTSATLARTDAANTFTGTQTMGASSHSDNLTMTVAAKGVVLKQGSNGLVGTFVANGASAVTVSNTSVAISDAIIISLNTVGGTVGVQPHVATITGGTGFTVVCTASDTSTYNYALIKNAA